MRLHFIAFGWLSLLAVANVAISEEWGTLKGHFIVKGVLPVVDESLQVGPQGELANVLVWVRTKGIAVHPEFSESTRPEAELEFQKGKFVPRVLVMQVGQSLKIKNSDPVLHNANAPLQGNSPFNIMMPADYERRLEPLRLPEALPAQLHDNINPDIRGWLLVRPNPYFAVSNSDGKIEIKNLPARTPLEFQVWHERRGPVENVVNGKPTGWKVRGRFTMELERGENDLGTIALDAKQF